MTALSLPAAPVRSAPLAFALRGRGEACGHHGEIFQGAVALRSGQVQPVLVTLPCAEFRVEASFLPDSFRPLVIEPAGCLKAIRAARLTLHELGYPELGGRLVLTGSIPHGQGFGSSTADVVAAIRAVTSALGQPLPQERVARLAVLAERAADPLMFGGGALLFAQRQGGVVEQFAGGLPAMDLLGLRDPDNGSGIDTLSLTPPDYATGELRRFERLLGWLRRAICRREAAWVGRVATLSAHLNQRYLPKPRLAEWDLLGRRCGALGIQVAHSGTAMGWLLRPGDLRARDALRRQLRRQGLGVESYWIPAMRMAPAPPTPFQVES